MWQNPVCLKDNVPLLQGTGRLHGTRLSGRIKPSVLWGPYRILQPKYLFLYQGQEHAEATRQSGQEITCDPPSSTSFHASYPAYPFLLRRSELGILCFQSAKSPVISSVKPTAIAICMVTSTVLLSILKNWWRERSSVIWTGLYQFSINLRAEIIANISSP